MRNQRDDAGNLHCLPACRLFGCAQLRSTHRRTASAWPAAGRASRSSTPRSEAIKRSEVIRAIICSEVHICNWWEGSPHLRRGLARAGVVRGEGGASGRQSEAVAGRPMGGQSIFAAWTGRVRQSEVIPGRPMGGQSIFAARSGAPLRCHRPRSRPAGLNRRRAIILKPQPEVTRAIMSEDSPYLAVRIWGLPSTLSITPLSTPCAKSRGDQGHFARRAAYICRSFRPYLPRFPPACPLPALSPLLLSLPASPACACPLLLPYSCPVPRRYCLFTPRRYCLSTTSSPPCLDRSLPAHRLVLNYCCLFTAFP